MKKSSKQSVIDGKRIFKSANVKLIHPVFLEMAESLSHIDLLTFIKIYDGRLCASNRLSDNGKKEPRTQIGAEGVVGVELLIDPVNMVVQFYSITSSQKGYGKKIVNAVVEATPADWTLVVPMDWSGGFWEKMIGYFPRIVRF